MDALKLLIADHNRVKGLFSRFKDAHEADDVDAMGARAMEIATELEVHTTIEEEIFYPWIRDLSSEIAETVDEGVEEHHVVKILLEEVSALEAGSETWVAKMTVIIENVEHHAKEEEAEMFPKVRSASDAEARDELGARLDARKGELGAPMLADTIDLTDDQLHELATAQAIPGRSSMAHDELAASVSPS
ncbi:MAG: hemerythrin domain-containing protein [Acidimicrobiales bacterium]